MANIKPFQGVLYSNEKVEKLEDVVTPPYDVISERERVEYFNRHPQNVIRLILSKSEPQDDENNNRYTRAAGFFNSWLDGGILDQDSEPAFYLTEMDFVSDGVAFTRLGLIALVQLEAFDEGGILPHEKTFSATKADRLRVMEECKANFSPIFSLFSDPDGEIESPLRACIEGVEPDLEFQEHIGFRHRLWRIVDPEIHSEIGMKLADKPLFIADGHHRYETALNYRDQLMSKREKYDPEAQCNFVMMYLSSMHDSGMIIRPVHRLLAGLPDGAAEGFVQMAQKFFDIEVMAFEEDSDKEVRSQLLARIRAEADRIVMGRFLKTMEPFTF